MNNELKEEFKCKQCKKEVIEIPKRNHTIKYKKEYGICETCYRANKSRE